MAKSRKNVRDFMAANPDTPAAVVAKKFRITPAYVYVLRSAMKKSAAKAEVKAAPKPKAAPAADMVNQPPHYTTGGIEVIDFIEAKGLDYHLGNVIKYLSRAGKKGDKLEDMKKARWYLDRAIERHGA